MNKLHPLMPSKVSRVLLRISLSLIVLSSVAFLISYLEMRAYAPATAGYLHQAMLEYLLASVVIALGGVLLVELTLRENAKK